MARAVMSDGPYALLLRWRLKPGRYADFARAWEEVTVAMLDQQSLGSALFEASDGTICALPRWPERTLRDRAMDSPAIAAAREAMADAVEEVLPPLEMTELINHWVSR